MGIVGVTGRLWLALFQKETGTQLTLVLRGFAPARQDLAAGQSVTRYGISLYASGPHKRYRIHDIDYQIKREGFLYWSDDGDLLAIRVKDWKIIFHEQRATGGIAIWREPFAQLRVPKIFKLRSDPFEKADGSLLYDKWMVDHAFDRVPAQVLVGAWLESFKDFPPRAKSASFEP